jgi:hypothetical protein
LPPVLAQKSNGYVFAGAGGFSGPAYSNHGSRMGHFGLGGEGVLGKGIGLGGELGLFTPPRVSSNWPVLASVNGYYHLPLAARDTWDVFATAGLTGGFPGRDVAVNFGGGLHYWFHRRLAARAEMRTHEFLSSYERFRLWGVRLGLAVR